MRKITQQEVVADFSAAKVGGFAPTTPGGRGVNSVAVTNAQGRVGDSELLGGYPADVAATPNTIVLRDAQGQVAGSGSLRGVWSDTTTSVLASNRYTKTIALNGTYSRGRLVIVGAVGNSQSGYGGATIEFTTNAADAICISNQPVSGVFTNLKRISNMTSLSGISVLTTENVVGFLHLENVWIDAVAKTLNISFVNGRNTGPATLQVNEARWEVFA